MESGPHVYGCLVCGKFFRGRGTSTPAYTHSVQEGHYIYIHLRNGTFHCLPDDYEIHDPSLRDISAALHPTFTEADIRDMDTKRDLTRDLFGRRYLPGFVGLNNLNKTDCINATVQALAHVPPLRDYFLRNYTGSTTTTTPLVMAFGELVRKLWSDQRFKSHVDPHILMQTISVASNKRFQIGQQAEAGEFMVWLLDQLHIGLCGGGRHRKRGRHANKSTSVIHTIFQGKVQVTTRQKKMQLKTNQSNMNMGDDRTGSDDEEEEQENELNNKDDHAEQPTFQMEETTIDTTFLQLTLDIPEKPLFRDDEGGLVIPQEPLVNVLKKFDGISFSDALSKNKSTTMHQQKRYRLLELPQYLILHLNRFTTNQYSKEKNPTIVAFPLKNLDLSKYLYQKEPPPTAEQVKAMSIKELKAVLDNYGQSDLATSIVEKSDLVRVILDFITTSLPDVLENKYDLVANITHDSPADVGREGKVDPLQEGSYKCHVQHKGTGQWYVMQDLHVEETMPQLIGISESYVLIFEKKKKITSL